MSDDGLQKANEELIARRATTKQRRQERHTREKREAISFKPETLRAAEERRSQIDEQIRSRVKRTEEPPANNGTKAQELSQRKRCKPDRRPYGILPGSLKLARGGSRQLPLPATLSGGPLGLIPEQLELPLPELASTRSVIIPCLPLTLYGAGGGTMQTRGRGAPVAQRLFIEALLTVGRLDRIPGNTATLSATLRDLVAWIWPNGWQRYRDLPALQRSLRELDAMRISWERREWRLVGVTALPNATTRMNDEIVLRIEHLPGSENGPLIDRVRLRSFGTSNAAAWRAYLRLAYLWDAAKLRNNGSRIYATRPKVARGPDGAVLDLNDKPLRKRGGAISKNWADPRARRIGGRERNPAADRVPMLGPDDLILLCFDDSEVSRATFRKRLHDARKAIHMMQAAGAVVVEHDGEGMRVLEPAPA